MALWQWTVEQDQPRLVCELLSPWSHGFFTRHGWPQVPETLTPVLDTAASVHRVKQVHGNRVLAASQTVVDPDAPASPGRPEADAIASDGSGQGLWVCTADCNPVLVGDRATGRTAAIHAGWRGTAQKIVPTALAHLQAQGSRLEDLVVAIGPAIAGDVYQVSVEVAAQVGRTMALAVGPDLANTSDLALVTALQTLEDAPVLPDPEPDKVRLDVRRVNLWQLRHLGLRAEQIAIAPHCTFQEPEQFFSYRRTGEKQVQWSGIVSR
jgi:YfiH family protein